MKTKKGIGMNDLNITPLNNSINQLQDFCNSPESLIQNNQSKIIRFTHSYTKTEHLPYKFYGVKTNLPIEKIEVMCMYIQLIRAKLPLQLYSDDIVGEIDGIELIELFYKDLYSLEIIKSDESIAFDYKINFHDNWGDMLSTPLSYINSVAIPNASIKTFEFFKTFLNTEKSSLRTREQLVRVEKVLNGEKILADWGWSNLFGDGVFGIYCLSSDEPEFVTR